MLFILGFWTPKHLQVYMIFQNYLSELGGETALPPLLSTASLQAQPGPNQANVIVHSVSPSYNYFMLMQFFSVSDLSLPCFSVLSLSLPVSCHYYFASPNTAAFNLNFLLF